MSLNFVSINWNKLIDCSKRFRCAVGEFGCATGGLADCVVPSFSSIIVEINPYVGTGLERWDPQEQEKESFKVY